MNTKPCKACKTPIDKEAKICPHCRTKQGMSLLRKIGLAILMFLFIRFALNQAATTEQTKPSTPDPTVIDHSLQYKRPDPSSQWALQTTQDTMTGKPQKIARLVSTNTLSLEFPYQGENKARLMVRQHPSHGTDVMVSVDKGQMICNTTRCSALIKFDDQKPILFMGSEPSDLSSTAMFITDSRRFIELAKKSTKILIQIDFYKNGLQTLEFEPDAPLEWTAQAKK